MCKWGDTVRVRVTIPASHSSTGERVKRVKPIDSCIADLVRAFESAGAVMCGSCCGHGKARPIIILENGEKIDVLSLSTATSWTVHQKLASYRRRTRTREEIEEAATQSRSLSDLGKILGVTTSRARALCLSWGVEL